MLFHTWTFLQFLLVVRGLYAVLPWRWQNGWLLLASYAFYGAWDWRFLSLLWVSTAVDWAVGRSLAAESRPGRRGALLGTSLAVNLGILATFKYFDFFAASAAALAARVGLQLDVPTLHLVLPVGISFYTFQTLGYTIDVYRGRIPACRSLSTFALFVAWFPQLVAGPIERAEHLLPQLQRPRRVDLRHWAEGGVLVLVGLVRKVCVADLVAPAVDRAFASPAGAPSAQLALGLLLFGLQIYGDFAGYSDMARGVSRLFGIELMVNFDRPYLASSIRDFWRRWHVSLSAWLRDYVYVPLGGSRCGAVRTTGNLLATMLLGGLWHGAGWHFVAWGGVHGLALAAHRLLFRLPGSPLAAGVDRDTGLPEGGAPVPGGGWPGRLAGWLATMGLVFAAWALFRAPDLAVAGQVLGGIASLRAGFEPAWLALPALAVGALVVLELPQGRSGDATPALLWPWPLQGAWLAALGLALLLLRAPRPLPFLYFQF